MAPSSCCAGSPLAAHATLRPDQPSPSVGSSRRSRISGLRTSTRIPAAARTRSASSRAQSGAECREPEARRMSPDGRVPGQGSPQGQDAGSLGRSCLGEPLRALRVAAAAGAAALAVTAASLGADAGPALALSTPYTQSENAQELGLLDGRIRQCPTALNPNCVSTSSLNFSYAEPWVIPPSTTSVETATRKIESAVMSSLANAKIVESVDTPEGHYILVEVDGVFGRDTMEFLVKEPEGEEVGIVLYRSLAGKVLYVYPFTTPITDFDAQRKRVATLAQELGWAQLAGACDYGVCSIYEDAEDDETIRVEPRLFPF